MTKTLKVLYLEPPDHSMDPWGKDVVELVGSQHELVLFDPEAPLAPQFENVDVVIEHGYGRGTRAMADVAAGSARLWQIVSVGFEKFDLDYFRQKKIPVANTPGLSSAVALGELALMLMLMLARRWHEDQENLGSGLSLRPVGTELANRHLGIVGLGASGIELARRARSCAMKISAIDVREVSSQEREELGLAFVGKAEDLDDLLPQVDYLSLHLHLNEKTHHIIDERRMGLLKPTARLINVARGKLVDEKALCAALAEGRLGGAGLDVFENEPLDPASPLLKLSNVVATPHIAGVTYETSRRRTMMALENVNRVAAGQEPLYRVDR